MSDLSSIFNKLSKGSSATSSPATWGNSSWSLGSSKASKVDSYVTVLKAPKGSEASTTSKVVAAKLGVKIDDKTGKPKKKQHHSLFGSIVGGVEDVSSNLVSDVINTAENTPAGLLKLATTNPVDSAKAIGHDYATRYGKLFKGDFGGFASDVAKHPFGYLLDASTLGTGSGAVLGRLVPKLAEGGEAALRVDRAAEGVSNTTKQLSRNVFTRNVFEKPAYALQRTLPQSIPVVGERASAVRHLTNQVESKIGQLGHAKQVFEKTVRDVRHASRKDDTLTQAFDLVSADIRHRPLQVFGQDIHTPMPHAFDAKRDTRISENPVRHSDEISALQSQIKSEIQLDASGNIVAKDGASAATHSFLKVHNAREALNQSVDKVGDYVAKLNPEVVARGVAKKTVNHLTGEGVTTVTKATKSTAKYASQVAPSTKSFLDGVRTVDTHTDPISNYLEMHGKAIKSAGNAIAKNFTEKYGDNPALTREITNIFDKHSPAGSLSGNFNRATQVWKDLVLVGRPAFLVNNYVGNQIMYHLKQGVGGISLEKASKGELNPAFDKHFFEHRQSLGSSERAAPRYDNHGNEIAPGRYRRTADKVYNLQSKHEQVLRKATMRESALSIPAIKTEMRRLIGEKNLSEGEALSQAMTKAFKDNPGYREIIAKAIDDTMGNYRHYNNFEKGLKQIVPFYGWNRHALRTYTSLIKDQPGRTSAIADIARQGQGEHDKNFPGTPTFMQGYVKGKFGTYDTGVMNPLKGGSDTLKSLKELVSGEPGNMSAIASNINPFIGGTAQALSGVNLTTGAPIKQGHGLGLIGSVLAQTGDQLPQVKVGQLAAKKVGYGTDYQDRSNPHTFLTPTGQLKRKFVDSEGKVMLGKDGLPLEAADRHMLRPSLENSVLAYLGIPKKDVNLKTAQEVQKSINSKLHPATDFHKRKSKAKTTTAKVVNVTTLGHKSSKKMPFINVGG